MTKATGCSACGAFWRAAAHGHFSKLPELARAAFAARKATPPANTELTRNTSSSAMHRHIRKSLDSRIR